MRSKFNTKLIGGYKIFFLVIISIVVVYINVVCFIMRLKNPQMTDTQLMLNMHNAIMCDFDITDK